eukprot:c16612_g1_i1 orf=136-2220(+)
MYKNQLQELAQRSCFNLPCYTCIREGPDHAPRFKATVSFNGEVFESAGYHSTLRQAEHAAAEVAIATLSQRGPTQSLAARILDETGVCKNLLQETAQRAGVSLPVYTTIRTGPKHLPLFKCVVEIGGRHFKGEPAKTKKQAEKNAATAAWSALNQFTTAHFPLQTEHPEACENAEIAKVHSFFNKDERPTCQHSSSGAHTKFTARSRAPINVRDRSRVRRDHNAGVGQFYSCAPSTAIAKVPNFERNQGGFLFNQQPVNTPLELNHELGQRFASAQKQPFCNTSHLIPDASFESPALVHQGSGFYNPQPSPSSYGGSSRHQGRQHQRRHSLSGMESPMPSREAMAVSRASGGGDMLGRVMLHHQQQQIRGLPYQSLSERFELNRPSLLEELQQRDEEDDWFHREATTSLVQPQSHSVTSVLHSQRDSMWRMPLQSQSERFELKTCQLSQLEEVHQRDEEEWLCGDNEGNDRHGSLDSHYGHRERWLQDEVSVHKDSKNLNFREGWLRGESLKHSLEEERRHGYREGWLRNGASKQISEIERNQTLKLDHTYGYQEGWRNKETAGSFMEKDRSYSQGHMYSKDMQKEKSAYVAGPPPATPSLASPLSSLWSKSTQWWGSHMPTSTSSAAAAVANTLGLRPPRGAVPAVKVRHLVPVCSAPPRHPDTPARRHPLHNDQPHVDNELEASQLLSKLRL